MDMIAPAGMPPGDARALSSAEAQQRLAKDGPNELPVSKPRTMLRLAHEVATEPMILLLVACGARLHGAG
jgi:P-type Ca2+ transporter type 2C